MLRKVIPQLNRLTSLSPRFLSSSSYLSDGEYIEQTFVSEKVAEFDIAKRRYKNHEEIFSVEVRKETLLDAEKGIKDKLSRYTNVIEMEEAAT